MFAPESWIRAFCNPNIGTDQLAELLTMSGLEVESYQSRHFAFAGVLVGKIIHLERHPNLAHLTVCHIDLGNKTIGPVVCGAQNLHLGAVVAYAPPGAVLPSKTLGSSTVIGTKLISTIQSCGMICSAQELLATDFHYASSDGVWLLDSQAQVGQSLTDYLNAEDIVFNIKVTPNLSHNLSIYGLAQSLSAMSGAPILPYWSKALEPNCQDTLLVDIQAQDLCGRFSGRVLRNINANASTPAFMVNRLAQCGQRSINILVDISNYAMFEFGQPSHIFDLDKISNKLVVRWAKPNEQVHLLNNKIIELDSEIGIIEANGKAESLAGIMGGMASATSNHTSSIFIEAAFWWPEAIAGRMQKLGFQTDAAYRFERGTNPVATIERVEYLSYLIQQHCTSLGTSSEVHIGPIQDYIIGLPAANTIHLSQSNIERTLGWKLPADEVQRALLALKLELTPVSDGWQIKPPLDRFDLKIPEDLVEEIIKVVGFSKIPLIYPKVKIKSQVATQSNKSLRVLRQQLLNLGYSETINYSFVPQEWEKNLTHNANPIKVLNPIASSMSVMRSSLIGSLLQVLQYNLYRQAETVRLFEIAKVFYYQPEVQQSLEDVAGIAQPSVLSGLAWGIESPRQWGKPTRVIDFFDVKGDIENFLPPLDLQWRPVEHIALHPGKSASLWHHDKQIGIVGALHPNQCADWNFSNAPIVFEIQLDILKSSFQPKIENLSTYPAVYRDISIFVPDNVLFDHVQSIVVGFSNKEVYNLTLIYVQLFDEFKYQNKKSWTLRIWWQSQVKTFVEAEINEILHTIVLKLSEIGCELRT